MSRIVSHCIRAAKYTAVYAPVPTVSESVKSRIARMLESWGEGNRDEPAGKGRTGINWAGIAEAPKHPFPFPCPSLARANNSLCLDACAILG